MKTSELRLQQDCWLWLWNRHPELRGLFFRIKNEGTNRITGARDKASGVIPGVADSCLLVPGGKAVFIEFKTESGKQSPVQSDWQAKVQGAWFRYEVVRSLDEFQTLIANLLT
ncbi:MAG TPA: hypothetical protein DF296_13655 [Candidatus Margulisbacteria bacterium]|nr:hypothetical protein [Candidatus Margulisiibacteriota bacterium]